MPREFLRRCPEHREDFFAWLPRWWLPRWMAARRTPVEAEDDRRDWHAVAVTALCKKWEIDPSERPRHPDGPIPPRFLARLSIGDAVVTKLWPPADPFCSQEVAWAVDPQNGRPAIEVRLYFDRPLEEQLAGIKNTVEFYSHHWNQPIPAPDAPRLRGGQRPNLFARYLWLLDGEAQGMAPSEMADFLAVEDHKYRQKSHRDAQKAIHADLQAAQNLA